MGVAKNQINNSHAYPLWPSDSALAGFISSPGETQPELKRCGGGSLLQNSLLQKEKKARVSIECHLNKILGWPKSSFGFFQLWIGWRLELGEVGFWGWEGREPEYSLGWGEWCWSQHFLELRIFFFFNYFLLLLFARIQFGFYYKIDQKHIFSGKKKDKEQLLE